MQQDCLKRGDAADNFRHRSQYANQFLDTPPESLRIARAAILCAEQLSLQDSNSLDRVITVDRARRIMILLEKPAYPGQLIPQLIRPRILRSCAQRVIVICQPPVPGHDVHLAVSDLAGDVSAADHAVNLAVVDRASNVPIADNISLIQYLLVFFDVYVLLSKIIHCDTDYLSFQYVDNATRVLPLVHVVDLKLSIILTGAVQAGPRRVGFGRAIRLNSQAVKSLCRRQELPGRH